ncbi:hypothetical protein OROHE_017371 [Orobanche hederae]
MQGVEVVGIKPFCSPGEFTYYREETDFLTYSKD